MATPNRRRLDLTPSSRPHGAQRMFAATTLTLEAVVVLEARETHTRPWRRCSSRTSWCPRTGC